MTLETYLFLMVAILLNIIVLAGFMLLVKLSWEFVIEPIVDHIIDNRVKYWTEQYNIMREKGAAWQARFWKIGIMPDVADNIINSQVLPRTDENERGNYEVTIKLEITPPVEERDE